ncbi:molybdenum cofactor guanylyltransferase [Corallococcus sp. M34]|nr:molybdenum cofactor guanylyltransferase [Citreicoccus inhibens]
MVRDAAWVILAALGAPCSRRAPACRARGARPQRAVLASSGAGVGRCPWEVCVEKSARAPEHPDVTLALIAGGRGTRLSGVAKGLLVVEGLTVMERQLALAPLFAEVVLVANAPEPYARFGLRTVPDAIAGKGAPGGVHAALGAARTPWVFAVACDMPFVSAEVVRAVLAARREDVDAVCGEVAGRWEPLLAVYRARLAGAWGDALAEDPSLRRLLERARTQVLPESELRAVDPRLRAWVNVNTHEELALHSVSLPPR